MFLWDAQNAAPERIRIHGMSSVSPKRTFKTHKTQETTATVVKTPSERMTQNANSANFQNASFAKRSSAKRSSEFQNAVLKTLRC